MQPFDIIVHDVGHGQAIHIRTQAGNIIVIDLGCKPDFSPLKWIKTTFGKIDRLLITHPHGDHIDEIEQLKPLGLEPRFFGRPGHLSKECIRGQNTPGDQPKVEAYLNLDSRYTERLAPGMQWGSGPADPITYELFTATASSDGNINNHSTIAYIEHAGWSFMFPGDNEPPSWRELLTNEHFRKRLQDTKIFAPSHHARESGFCEDIFEFLKPQLYVVSDKEVGDTDASAKYSSRLSGNGLFVKRPSGVFEQRRLLTTRSDGTMRFSIAPGSTNLDIFVSR